MFEDLGIPYSVQDAKMVVKMFHTHL